MYDWDRERVIAYIENNSANNFLYIKYTWKQLGLSQEWYDKQCKELLYNWRAIRREVDLEWTKSSDNSVFEEEILEELFKFVQQTVGFKVVSVKKENPLTKEINTLEYSIALYKELDPKKVYFVGSDVGGGLGKDYSTLVITDPTDNYKEVGIFKSNVINTKNFSDLAITLVVDVIPKGVLFIENNSYGKGVIDNILDHPIAAKKIYYEYKIQDKDKTKSNPKQATESIQYGINTNTATRNLMIDILMEIVAEYPENIVSEEVYDDIKGLIFSKTGKVEHDIATHDDCLFGKLMVLYAVRYGNNIAKFLRDVHAMERTAARAKALSRNNVLNKVVSDPAVDKGMNIDFEELKRFMNTGGTYEEYMENILAGSTKNVNINKAALAEMYMPKRKLK